MDAKRLYEDWLRLWEGDYARAEAILADDVVAHWPEHDVEGRDALVDAIRETHAAVRDLRFALAVGPLADGDLLAARWTGSGRAEDGATRFLGNDLMRLRDGRIAEYWVASWMGS